MTDTPVESGHARLLILAMEQDFPAKIEEWKQALLEGRITPEMHSIFTFMGYPVPKVKAQRKRREPVKEATVEAVASQDEEALDGMGKAGEIDLTEGPSFGAGTLSDAGRWG